MPVEPIFCVFAFLSFLIWSPLREHCHIFYLFHYFCLSTNSPPPALPPKKRQSAPSPTRVAVVAPMSRGSSLPCSVHRQVSNWVRWQIKFSSVQRPKYSLRTCAICLSSRTTSRSSCRDASLGGVSLTGVTLHACLHAAVWGNLASRMSSSPPLTRTAVSVLVTPAARLSVRQRVNIGSNLEFFIIIQFDWNLIIQFSQSLVFIWKHFVSRRARNGVTFNRGNG